MASLLEDLKHTVEELAKVDFDANTTYIMPKTVFANDVATILRAMHGVEGAVSRICLKGHTANEAADLLKYVKEVLGFIVQQIPRVGSVVMEHHKIKNASESVSSGVDVSGVSKRGS